MPFIIVFLIDDIEIGTITNPAVFPFANFPCKPAIPLTIITVTSTDPPEGDITGEYTVNVYGSNFSSPAVVMFDGIPATDVVVLNSGEISCTPPPSLTINHFVDVTVQCGFFSGILYNGFFYTTLPF